MKKIYIIITILFLGIQLNAQITLTQAFNEPVIGDVWTTEEFDSTTVIPKNTGTTQSWNFNTTLTTLTYTGSSTYTNAASGPSATAYPAATIAFVRSSGTKGDFYKSSTNKFEFLGFVDGNQVVFSAPATWYNWPISYASANSATFTATETNGTNTASWAGTANYLASGTGTVTLPGGTVYNNCLQLRRIIDVNVTGFYTAQFHIVQYEYFSNLRKLPIAKVEYFTSTTGTVVSKNVNIQIDKAAQSVGINELEISKNNIIVYPNPSGDIVNIQLPNNVIAENLEVIDVNGKIVAYTSNSNAIDLSAINKGVYFIRITNKEMVLQKPIVLIH